MAGFQTTAIPSGSNVQVKTGAGMIRSITISFDATPSVLTIYDGVGASGVMMAFDFDSGTASTVGTETHILNWSFGTGLYIVADANITDGIVAWA